MYVYIYINIYRVIITTKYIYSRYILIYLHIHVHIIDVNDVYKIYVNSFIFVELLSVLSVTYL